MKDMQMLFKEWFEKEYPEGGPILYVVDNITWKAAWMACEKLSIAGLLSLMFHHRLSTGNVDSFDELLDEIHKQLKGLDSALELLALKTDWNTCPFCDRKRPDVPGPKSPHVYVCLEHRHLEYLVNRHHPVA